MTDAASSVDEHSWKVPRGYTGQPWAVLIARSEVDGVTISWDPRGDERSAPFVRKFLAAQLRGSPESDLAFEVNFLYVVLRRAPEPDEPSATIGRDTPIAEFGCGAPPASPEDWPLISLGTLLRMAAESLENDDGR
jgi:hypothetical protein